MAEFYIITKFSDGIGVGHERFGHYEDAVTFMKQNGTVNGPQYAIVEIIKWHKKVADPHWTFEKVCFSERAGG